MSTALPQNHPLSGEQSSALGTNVLAKWKAHLNLGLAFAKQWPHALDAADSTKPASGGKHEESPRKSGAGPEHSKD